MKLYSYQENVLLAIDADPSHSQLISMPTGTGKTITFLSCARRKGKKCLILVHRKELLDQTFEKAKAVGYQNSEISVITADDKEDLNLITIAMVQSLNRSLAKYRPDDIEMIIVDEAHHAIAESYQKIFSWFRIFEEQKLLLGFTATPLRGDSACLGSIFKSHSFKMTLSEATQNGYICPVQGIRVDIEKSLENIELLGGDYNPEQLEKVMNCDAVNELIVDRCEHLGKLPAIIFATSVNHAQKLSSLLTDRGKKCACVSYKSTKTELEKVFKDLRSGDLEFITNVAKLSEGFDYPPIQGIILARPTRSPVLYKQMIGRGIRNHPDKYECLVLEFSGNDANMIRWEDIDENCTFQSCTLKEKKDRQEAILEYKSKFPSQNVKIIDVRISPFKFYECKIRRLIKYRKEFRALPFSEGFCVFEFVRIKKPKFTDVYGYNSHVHMCFWEKPYKSFFVWDGGGPLWESSGPGWAIEECEKQALHYANCQGGGLSKWYPSEEQEMTHKQKSFLKNPIKTSARKAEMHIEDCAIKQAIQKYWIDSTMGMIDGEDEGDELSDFKNICDKIKHKRTLYQLGGVY